MERAGVQNSSPKNPGPPGTKTDVESTPGAEYTHVSGVQSPPGPSQAEVQPRSRVQGPTSVRSESQTRRHNTGSGEQSPRGRSVASRRAALSLTLAIYGHPAEDGEEEEDGAGGCPERS